MDEETNYQRIYWKSYTQKHGDTYCYHNALYVNTRTKIEISCNIHGSYFQTPNQHLGGSGCCKCRNEKIGKLKRTTQKQFIDKANLVHNNKYNYSKVTYINNCTKIEIICNLHGTFYQAPSKHLIGQGCSKCVFKTETRCREALEKIVGQPFPKCRPLCFWIWQ